MTITLKRKKRRMILLSSCFLLLQEGAKLNVSSVKMTEGATKPPEPLNEATLTISNGKSISLYGRGK